MKKLAEEFVKHPARDTITDAPELPISCNNYYWSMWVCHCAFPQLATPPPHLTPPPRVSPMSLDTQCSVCTCYILMKSSWYEAKLTSILL